LDGFPETWRGRLALKTPLILVLMAILAGAAFGQASAEGCGLFPRTVRLAEGQTLSFNLSNADRCTLSLLYRVPRAGSYDGCTVFNAVYVFAPSGSPSLVSDTMQDRVCFADGDKVYSFPRQGRPQKVSLTSLGGEVEVTLRENALR
jgi:hypothetical protein